MLIFALSQKYILLQSGIMHSPHIDALAECKTSGYHEKERFSNVYNNLDHN